MSVAKTFLFTDIEGSTRKWEEYPTLMAGALARHDEVMSGAIARHDGTIVSHTGDGLLAVFDAAPSALRAAADAQAALATVVASAVEPLRVRMGVHRGEAVEAAGNFFGPTLNRCARMMAVAHGGQVVLSDDVARAPGVGEVEFTLLDLGSHQLRDVLLPVAVYQLQVDGLPCEFPPLRTVGKQQHNLPEPVSSFIGRVKVLETVDDLLDARRLVTVVGPGGCGKTRVAIEAAAARVARNRDGAWFVELADLPPGGDVAAEVAAALRIAEETGRPIGDTLCERLSQAEMLVVLDNCEHLIPQVASVVVRLLERCPDVRVLATSQARIGVPGEALLSIQPLDLPAATSGDEAESVRLFLDRAVLVRPDFSPDEDELAAIARVCRRLEGIPLAIELAASRLHVLSLAQLEQRLDQRFALLAGTSQRVARQRTLRATVEWSYELLPPAEQRAWCALSTFVGGFDLEAAASVLGVDDLSALDTLAVLIDRSILHTVARRTTARYRMLETMRDFGREQLIADGQIAEARARHRAWMLELAARVEPDHMTRAGPGWHNRLDTELPNIRFAIESGLEDGVPGESLRLCADLGIFFWLRGHLAQGRDWCERSLATATDAELRLRARGWLSLGELAFGQLDFDASAPALEEAVRLSGEGGDLLSAGWAHMFLAAIYAVRGEVDKAIGSRDEALRVAEELTIPSVTAGAYYWVGAVNATLGDEEGAAYYLERSVTLAREVGSPYTLARYLPLYARRLHAEGAHAEALVVFDEAIEVSRAAGDRIGLARSLQFMAERNVLSGDYERAAERLDEAQPIVSREIDDPTLACRVELTRATLLRHRGDLTAAQAHVDRALARAQALKDWRTTMDPYLVQAELLFDSGDVDRALTAIGVSLRQSRATNHAARTARALVVEARILTGVPDLDAATSSLDEAEKLFGSAPDPIVTSLIADVRGLIALADGRAADAVEALRHAASIATGAGARLMAIECTEDLSRALRALGDTGAADALQDESAAARKALGTPRPPSRPPG